MKIIALTTYDDGKVGFLLLETDSNIFGLGQFGGKDIDITIELFHRRVAPSVINMNIDSTGEIIELSQTVLRFELNYKMMGVQLNKAIAGLDSACWDALGKAKHASVAKLLGGELRPVPCYASSISRQIEPLTLAYALKKLRNLHGINAFKVKVGKRMGGNIDVRPGRTAEVIKTCREVLGKDSLIAVDANGAYDTKESALQISSMLREHGYWFFEEPFPWYNYDKYSSFQSRLPVAAGEQEFRADMWKNILKTNCWQISQPDFGYAGGFSQVLKILQNSRDFGKQTIPHSPQIDLSPVMAIHLACSFPNEVSHVEIACVNDGIAHLPLSDMTGEGKVEYFDSYLQVRNGQISLKNEDNIYGWGIALSQSWLSKAHRRVYNPEEPNTLRSTL